MGYFTTALEGKDFLCGSEPTLADCYALPMLRNFTKGTMAFVPKETLDAYPAVTAYLAKLMAIPAVAKWYEGKA